MNTTERRERLIAQLKDKRYRDAFVSEHIATGIPFQIRALRKQRKWIQRELAEHAGMLQERISVAENPNYAKFNLQTLKKIASAFDVALIVRFVTFSELVKWELNLSSEALEAVSFDDDPYFKEMPRYEYATAYSRPEPPIYSYIGSVEVRVGGEGIVKVIYPSEPSIKKIPNIADYRKPIEPQKEMRNPLQKAIMGA